MKLNDTVLTLNTTAQVVHGVELSRDQTGVTAKISASNHTVSVHFDGYTVLIHMRGTLKLNPKAGVEFSSWNCFPGQWQQEMGQK